MGRLDGKVAIISGGSKGIGYATSSTFAREGASVVVVGSNAEAAEKTAAEIVANGGKAIGVGADVTSNEGRQSVFDKAIEAFGKVDILVNNAGWGCKKPFLETDEESFDRSINLNLKATYYMSQKAVEIMKEQGNGGSIVSIASTAALQGERNSTIYSTTKAGIIAMVRAIANEVGQYGINVNAVLPGFTRTNNNGHVPEAIDENFKPITPMGRITVAQDIANACLFFVSDEAHQITAQFLPVDGGFSGTRIMQTAMNATMERK